MSADAEAARAQPSSGRRFGVISLLHLESHEQCLYWRTQVESNHWVDETIGRFQSLPLERIGGGGELRRIHHHRIWSGSRLDKGRTGIQSRLGQRNWRITAQGTVLMRSTFLPKNKKMVASDRRKGGRLYLYIQSQQSTWRRIRCRLRQESDQAVQVGIEWSTFPS